jgi:hypothetical protein
VTEVPINDSRSCPENASAASFAASTSPVVSIIITGTPAFSKARLYTDGPSVTPDTPGSTPLPGSQ